MDIEVKPFKTSNGETIWLPKEKESIPPTGCFYNPYTGNDGPMSSNYMVSALEVIAYANGVNW